MLGSWSMKKLLAIIILSLCFITPTHANDIRDFQIEGFSVGDSLLDYFKESEIKKGIVPFKKTNYKDNSFSLVGITKNAEVYDRTQFHIKKDDPK